MSPRRALMFFPSRDSLYKVWDNTENSGSSVLMIGCVIFIVHIGSFHLRNFRELGKGSINLQK